MRFVPKDKLEDFKLIASKPQHYFTGYTRVFITLPDFYKVSIDTRYDDDLRAIGLI